MESIKSAEVVGRSRIELILYIPIASHTRLRTIYTIFAVCVSASNFPKVFSTETMDVRGVRIAELVVEIVKMFRLLPAIYIIKAVINICCPGLVAIDMAWA